MDLFIIAMAIWVLALLAGAMLLTAERFRYGPSWSPHKTKAGWVMRRRVSGQVETRRASEAEATKAQADADYEWWATR